MGGGVAGIGVLDVTKGGDCGDDCDGDKNDGVTLLPTPAVTWFPTSIISNSLRKSRLPN